MGKDRNDNKSASSVKAAPIAQHRKKLGDRERFEQFERKEPRRVQQLKAAARKERRSRDSDDDLSIPVLLFVITSFTLFICSAIYLIIHHLLPPAAKAQ